MSAARREEPAWSGRGWCAECLHRIVFDSVFGWLHEDFGTGGRSFDHRAVPLLDEDRS